MRQTTHRPCVLDAPPGEQTRTTSLRALLTLVSLGIVALLAFAPLASAASERRSARAKVSVIVRELPGAGERPERLVFRLGGSIGQRLGIINGFAARIPEDAVTKLRHARGIHSVTLDRKVRLLDKDEGEGDDGDEGENEDENDDGDEGENEDGNETDVEDEDDDEDKGKDKNKSEGKAEDDGVDEDDLGSMFHVAQEEIGAGRFWKRGITGKGVDVALIDSGVVPVDGLTAPGKVVHGPDLSFESQADNLRHLDTFGHGTHMAGIIAGRDDDVSSVRDGDEDNFLGLAPGARIVSVKVADRYGATDVSQVIAAIDWVVQHRRDNGLNIRILNLSFGTDGVQDYRLDPLAYAAEVAWRKGIVVVVAAGNGGFGSAQLNNPAYDPYVIAVGGADGNGTRKTGDDTVPEWSSYGDGLRNPDLVAPGKSIVSLRSPGSYIDDAYPEGIVGARFFRGSGTSQAAAVVSGAAALIIEQRPTITPDQLKALLTRTASQLPVADTRGQGAGMLNLKIAEHTATPSSVQMWQPSTGTGSLELARGSDHLTEGGVDLRGEQDIFGAAWDGNRWSAESWAGTSWSGGFWNGNRWSGDFWSGSRWSGSRWSGNRWSGNRWSGTVWSGNRWSGSRWSGEVWTGTRWSGNRWSGNRWSTRLDGATEDPPAAATPEGTGGTNASALGDDSLGLPTGQAPGNGGARRAGSAGRHHARDLDQAVSVFGDTVSSDRARIDGG